MLCCDVDVGLCSLDNGDRAVALVSNGGCVVLWHCAVFASTRAVLCLVVVSWLRLCCVVTLCCVL